MIDPVLGDYTPDKDLKLHSENAIKLICKAFQSHEAGYPEWPKNAADEYARTDAPEKDRIIVLLSSERPCGWQVERRRLPRLLRND